MVQTTTYTPAEQLLDHLEAGAERLIERTGEDADGTRAETLAELVDVVQAIEPLLETVDLERLPDVVEPSALPDLLVPDGVPVRSANGTWTSVRSETSPICERCGTPSTPSTSDANWAT